MRRDLIFHDSVTLMCWHIDKWNNYWQLTVWHLTNPGNWASIWSAKCVFSDRKKCVLCKTESVLRTKNRSGPAKNRFSVALSWRLFDVWTSLFGIMSQYDPKFDLKINIGHCDLYSMVQLFCVTSLKLFDIWIYGSVWPQNKCRSVWPIFNGPVIFSCISKTIWRMSAIFSDNETVWPKLWPQSKYKSTWPILHGLVILPNLFKIIWWMNIIVGIMDQCDT